MYKVLLLVLAAGLAPIVAAAAPERSEGANRPALRLISVHPVKLRGVRFKPSERIRVTVVSKALRQQRRVNAGSAGSFVATFGGLPYDRCSSLFAVAVGASGTRATLKLPEPACPPRL